MHFIGSPHQRSRRAGQQPSDSGQQKSKTETQQDRQTAFALDLSALAPAFGLRYFRLGSDSEKIKYPENTGKNHRAHTQRRQGCGAEWRTE